MEEIAYWYSQRCLLESRVRDLRNSIESLSVSCEKLGECLKAAEQMPDRLQKLPSEYSDWQGNRARECFEPLCGGALYEAYRHYALGLEELLVEMRERQAALLDELNTALDNYQTADYYWRQTITG